ncbi:MAG: hypothetical protein VYA49_06925 [Planctomycetota bacterium]|nr:hypothetical protein [Planctomycetota bacterium]
MHQEQHISKNKKPVEDIATPLARPDRTTFEAHLARRRYGHFTLTEAIRPAWQLGIVPEAGYRHDSYHDPVSGENLPAIVAAVSSERLFETFLQLIDFLGDTCDVVLESSHEHKSHPKEYRREGIERILLESQLWNFEDLLLNDGCTSIAVLHAQEPFEVQLDEHKLLITYGPTLDGFETILSEQGVRQKDNLRVISQGDHMHTSTSRYTSQFEDLVSHLHADL